MIATDPKHPDTFPQPSEKTCKTGETCNAEFLAAIFPPDAVVAVCSLADDPTQASGWKARRWAGSGDRLAPSLNNFYSLATFRLDDDGKVVRRKTHFVALHGIMLDDIGDGPGSKVAADRLTLPPSYLIETSPGNHQAGYLFAEPITDHRQADALLKAVAGDAGDEGGNGLVRWCRLPVGINGKAKYRDADGEPFACRLVEWHPERRYTVEAFVEGLGLDVQGEKARKRRKAPAPTDEENYLPAPATNPVIARLKEVGLYRKPTGDGWHEIECPWASEHGGEDRRAYYAEPSGLFKRGGFKCHHTHGGEKGIRQLLEFLVVDPIEAQMRPIIRVMAGDLHIVVDTTERELAANGHHFQRGGSIVRVETDTTTDCTAIRDIAPEALAVMACQLARWERFDGRSGEWAATDPPAKHIRALASQSTYRHLPPLRGLARQPYLRHDGAVVQAAGYDADAQLFGVFDAREFAIPDRPSPEQAHAALGLLMESLADFEFATEGDRSAALAALLTAAVRPTLDHAPMFHVAAPLRGSGKSYLCDLIAALASPDPAPPDAFPGDDAEFSKLILARLAAAPAVVCFDNLTTDLRDHKSLCTAITSPTITGRVLGESKTITVSTRSLFLSSGNNVGPIGDMTRRCLSIRLQPQCEDPVTRVFRHPDLLGEIRRRRGEYVSAALTIVRAWIVAGRPAADLKNLASFGQWTGWVRQPLVWLGLPDPATGIFEQLREDPEREQLGRMLAEWARLFPHGGTVAKAIDYAENHIDDEFRELLLEVAGERGRIISRLLGWWIRRHAGRIVEGRQFGKGSRHREWVAHVSHVSPVFSGQPGKVANDSDVMERAA